MREFDSAEFLRTDKDVAAFLKALLDDGDPRVIKAGLGAVERAKILRDRPKDK